MKKLLTIMACIFLSLGSFGLLQAADNVQQTKTNIEKSLMQYGLNQTQISELTNDILNLNNATTDNAIYQALIQHISFHDAVNLMQGNDARQAVKNLLESQTQASNNSYTSGGGSITPGLIWEVIKFNVYSNM